MISSLVQPCHSPHYTNLIQPSWIIAQSIPTLCLSIRYSFTTPGPPLFSHYGQEAWGGAGEAWGGVGRRGERRGEAWGGAGRGAGRGAARCWERCWEALGEVLQGSTHPAPIQHHPAPIQHSSSTHPAPIQHHPAPSSTIQHPSSTHPPTEGHKFR